MLGEGVRMSEASPRRPFLPSTRGEAVSRLPLPFQFLALMAFVGIPIGMAYLGYCVWRNR